MNAGSIIIGTKVDNKGLKDGLKDTKAILNEFDKKTEQKTSMSPVSEMKRKELAEENKILLEQQKNIKDIQKEIDRLTTKLKEGREAFLKLTPEEQETNMKKMLYEPAPNQIKKSINGSMGSSEIVAEKGELTPLQTLINYQETLKREAEKRKSIAEQTIKIKEEEIKKADEEWSKLRKNTDELKEQNNIISGIKDAMGEELGINIDDTEGLNVLSSLLDQAKQVEEEQITLEADIDLREFHVQKAELLQEAIDIANQMEEAVKINPDLGEEELISYLLKLDAVMDKLDELDKKQEQVGSGKGFSGINANLDKMNSKLSKITKSVGRWALAVFGVQTAYSFIRQAMDTLSQYNETMANQISNIKLVLTSALEPVVNRILSLVITLLNYLNYLSIAWFGVDLFARASELATKKTADNIGGAVGSAKELNKEMKQLAGFDEMNILQDNKSSSGGGAAGGGGGAIDTSGFDLPTAEIPEWLKWIADHGDFVRLLLEGIATAILAIKWGLSLIQGLGLFLMIDGIVKLIKDLKEYLEDKTWSNFNKVMTDIGEIVLGLSLLLIPIAPHLAIVLAVLGQIIMTISALPKWIESVIRFIKDPSWDNYFRTIRDGVETLGVVGKVIGWIFDKLGILQPQIKTTEEAERDLKEATEQLTSAQDLYVNSVDRAEEAQKKLNEAQERTGLSGEELYNQVQQGVLDYKNMTAEQKEVYKAYLNNENAQNNLKDATDKLAEAKKNEKIASLENSLAVANESKNFDDYKKAVMTAFENGEISADEARDLIGKAMSGMSDDSKKTFTKDIPDNIKKGLDKKEPEKEAGKLKSGLLGIFGTMGTEVGTVLGGAIGGALKSIVNAIMSFIENKINTMVSNINSFIGLINKIPGVNIGKLSKVKLPRLAKGGIINQPGKGVPVGNAIAGEKGQEGVIPLTDAQQMALLGEAIGKYITINANITNTMNGRVISRELQKINNESDFAFNR